MKSDCIICGVAILVLSLGACTSDKDNNITGGTGGFGATGGNTLLAGQGGQTNGGSPTATSGQDAAIDASVNTATGDAAEIVDGRVTDGGGVDGPVVDSGVVDDIVVADGQVLLPRPTGRYRVGLSERVMTPGAGPVGNADGPIAPFTPYFTRVFYPIDPAYTGETFKINSSLASVACTTSDQVLTHSYPNANMVPGTHRFPVVLFAPGSGGPIDIYVSILEDLASHGYVVVGFQPEQGTLDTSSFDLPLQPAPCASKEEWAAYYRAMMGAQTSPSQETSAFVARWLADAVHTLDQIEQLDQHDPAGILTGRLDLKNVGMFGHSIGGATAREACVTDSRFKACGNLDGTFFGEHVGSPMTRPLMIQITGDHNDMKTFMYNAGYIDINDPTIQTVWNLTKDAAAYRIVIRDIAHQSFADLNIVAQHFIFSDTPAGDAMCVLLWTALFSMQCVTKEDYLQFSSGTLDPVRSINISKAYTRAFFDKHLKGISQDLLKGPSAAYPEVTFEAKNP